MSPPPMWRSGPMWRGSLALKSSRCRTRPPETVCCQEKGGLCASTGGTQLVNKVAKNFYQLLRLRSIGREELPIFITLSDASGGTTERLFIVDLHGAGENIIGVVAQAVEGHKEVFTIVGGGESQLRVATLHRILWKFLRVGASALPLRVVCCRYIDACVGPFFAVRLMGESSRSELMPARRAGAAKAKDVQLPFGLSMSRAELPKSGSVGDAGNHHPQASDSESEGALSSMDGGSEDRTDSESLGGSSEDEEATAIAAAPLVAIAPPKPPAEVAPERAPQPGLVDFDVAPSGRAKCFLCGQAIPKGSWRLSYQVRSSWTLSDCKRLHPHCTGQLPATTREFDRGKLRTLSERSGLREEARRSLEAAGVALKALPDSASSGA